MSQIENIIFKQAVGIVLHDQGNIQAVPQPLDQSPPLI